MSLIMLHVARAGGIEMTWDPCKPIIYVDADIS